MTKKKKQVDIIVLKFTYLIEEDPVTFKIVTPSKFYLLKLSHETAKSEWITLLKKSMSIAHLEPPVLLLHEEKEDGSPLTQFKLKRFPNTKIILSFLGEDNIVTKEHKLKTEGPWRVGRSKHNDLIVEDEIYVSRNHFEIEMIENVFWLKDLGSAAGTILNGEHIIKAPLKPGDIIKISNLHIRFNVKNTIFQNIKKK
jgi:hypothetical protein